MKILIGIDDTDNLESRGTGFRSRTLGKELEDNGYGKLIGVSRHQLYVNPLIPYTSHNSSLCVEFEAHADIINIITEYSMEFLEKNCAEGSDPGLCISPLDNMPDEIIEFGKRAKANVLTKEEAVQTASRYDIHLSEHGGTGGGIIGSLAGVGLRASGQDGRYVWVKGIREIEGVVAASTIFESTGVKQIVSEAGETPSLEDYIDVGDWFRPVLLNGVPTLLIEGNNNPKARWKIIDRESIKSKY